MHKIKVAESVGLTALVLGGGMLVASPALAGGQKDHKVTICHFTASETNPVVVITIDRHALKHHIGNHTPPVHRGTDFVITGVEGETEADCVVPDEDIDLD